MPAEATQGIVTIPTRSGATGPYLVDRHFAEVLVEAPSDTRHGMSEELRLGPDHLEDIRALQGAVAANARKNWVLGQDFPRELSSALRSLRSPS